MVKSCLLALVLAAVAYVPTPSVFAQESETQQGGMANQQSAPSSEHGMQHGRFDPTQRAAMLGQKLSLSPDQQAKVEDILKSEQSQMQSLRSNSSGQDRHAKMMELHKSTTDQIRAILNPDQQKKFDEMISRREQGMKRQQQDAQQ